MLVKKVFDRPRRCRRRNWKLQRMADGLDTESVEKSVGFSAFCLSFLRLSMNSEAISAYDKQAASNPKV